MNVRCLKDFRVLVSFCNCVTHTRDIDEVHKFGVTCNIQDAVVS